MRDALKLNHKPLKILGFHGYQSFQEGEVTADLAHEIGKKLAQELWGDKFQVVVATHCNTNHYHNHFVICGTSFLDGTRYPASKATYQKMREVSDRLCREYGLSVIENPVPGKTKHYAEWQAEQADKPTWRSIIKADIDLAISKSITDKQFFFQLRQMGYQYKVGKDISVRPPDKERFFRLARNLGEEYTLQSIYQKILSQEQVPRQSSPEPNHISLHIRLNGTKRKIKRIGGLRGLYYHYCYRLGIFPKKKAPSPARMNFILKEDLLKLDKIIEETKLLSRCRIDTREQLFSYQESLHVEIRELNAKRKKLRSALRRTDNVHEKAALKKEIASLSQRLSKQRKEVGLCEGIAERSGIITEKLKKIKYEKEEQNHEHRRRSSRPNSKNQSERSRGSN